MICEFCGRQTKSRKVRKQHWLAGKLYLVENVTAQVWGECGERYFQATVLDQVDAMLRTDHPVKEHLSVEVVSFV